MTRMLLRVGALLRRRRAPLVASRAEAPTAAADVVATYARRLPRAAYTDALTTRRGAPRRRWRR